MVNASLHCIGAYQMKFNIVNEIKLSYSRKGNSDKVISNSYDAAEGISTTF